MKKPSKTQKVKKEKKELIAKEDSILGLKKRGRPRKSKTEYLPPRYGLGVEQKEYYAVIPDKEMSKADIMYFGIEKMGLPKTKVERLTDTLIKRNYLVKNKEQRYIKGYGLKLHRPYIYQRAS